MQRFMRVTVVGVLLAVVLTALPACDIQSASKADDVYIYFTGDAHGADDEGLGYAGVKATVEYTRGHVSPYVTLVDTGDAVWGDFLGNESEGAHIVELMNDVGYDYAVLGNHEFDYGMERLRDLMELSDAAYLGCNVTYTGKGNNPLDALLPYAVETYGDMQVGFVGVTTPESLTAANPMNFREDGEFVYDFGNDTPDGFYALVQEHVDACREDGADYVVLLTHLGDTAEYGAYASPELIAATTGVDAVLDGHAHSVIPCRMVQNKNGSRVPLASTGTQLENIGQLLISREGGVAVTLINGDIARDAELDRQIQTANATYDELMQTVVGKSDFALPIRQEEGGERIVRNRETALGNFCADAYRAVTGAEISVINGGGLRAALPAGDITYADIMALHPYGNNICVVYATGEEIADALEFACRFSSLDEGGEPVGENGGFLHVSGLTFTVDTATPSGVVTDGNGMFVSVEGTRRVRDIMTVGEDGTEVPLDRQKTYTLASFDFILQDCGDGFTMFADNEYALRLGQFDYESVIAYLATFEDKTVPARYVATEGRITIQ